MDSLSCAKLLIAVYGEESIEKIIKEWLANLPLRQKYIIEKRFGLEDGKSLTLEEVSKEFNVTRERIRLIENEGLDRIRSGIPKGDLSPLHI